MVGASSISASSQAKPWNGGRDNLGNGSPQGSVSSFPNQKLSKVGVIGLGSIGMRHARNLRALGHPVLGYDPNYMHPLVQKDSGIERRATLGELVDESEAIIIASPTAKHLEHAVFISERSKAPVLMEKPIANQPWRFVPVGSIITMVGYNLRFHHCVRKAKGWLDEKLIGKLLWGNFVCAQYNTKEVYRRDGVILNWSHEIDLALHLVGPYEHIDGANGDNSIADILITHKNGCRSTIHLDYLTRPEIRQTIIVGSDGAIIIDLVQRQAWLRDRSGAIIERFDAEDSYDENYIDELKAFFARANGQQTIGATAADGLEVLDVCLVAEGLIR